MKCTFRLPETRGKTIDEIVEHFRGSTDQESLFQSKTDRHDEYLINYERVKLYVYTSIIVGDESPLLSDNVYDSGRSYGSSPVHIQIRSPDSVTGRMSSMDFSTPRFF